MPKGKQKRTGWHATLGRTAVMAVSAVSVPVLAVGTAGASPQGASRLTAVTTSGHGTVLAAGNTVYSLKASSTPCNAACLKIWPAVVLAHGTKHASAGSGVTASKLGVVKVPGVGMQVTYGGKRLYRFSGDTAPGQVNGNVTDTWGKWTAILVSKSPGSSSSSGSGSGNSSAGTGGVSF